ncbi:hypothetical protein KI387_036828, partial [Taxus chinensis]
KEEAPSVPMNTSTQDVVTATTMEVPTIPSSNPPPPPPITQTTTPMVVSSPSSSLPSPTSSIFSSLVDLSSNVSSILSQIPSIYMSFSSPLMISCPVSTSVLDSLSIPLPSVSTFFPEYATVAPPFTPISSSSSDPNPISP